MDELDSDEASNSNEVGKLVAYILVYVARILFTSLLLFIASKVEITRNLMKYIRLDNFGFLSYLFLSFVVHTILICFKRIDDGDE